MPFLGDHDIYDICDEMEYDALLEASKNHILVIKVYSPVCRACKALEPKFIKLKNDFAKENVPVVFAEMSSFHTTDLIRDLDIHALPTVQLYVAGELQSNVECAPSKVPQLKEEMIQLVKENVDFTTRALKKEEEDVHVKIPTWKAAVGDFVDDYIGFILARQPSSSRRMVEQV